MNDADDLAERRAAVEEDLRGGFSHLGLYLDRRLTIAAAERLIAHIRGLEDEIMGEDL